MSTVSNNIKKFRTLKNLPQKFLANKLGISQSAYQKIETGETDLSVSKLEVLAEVLEVPLTELLTSDDKHVYNNVSTNNKGGNGMVINHADKAIELYEKLIIEKDKQIELLRNLLDTYKPKKK